MHFVRIIYCFFFSIRYNACAVCVSFWETNRVNNAFKNKVLQMLPKWHYGLLIGMFGGIIWHFYVLSTKCFYLLLLLIFFLFQIKTCGFHLKEEGKELLGMLMAALANNNGVLCIVPVSFVLFK